MSDKRPSLDSLFEAALQIESADQRGTFLDQSCGDDTELRRQVEQLLESYEQAGSFLEKPPAELEAALVQDLPEVMQAGLAPAFRKDEAVVVGNAGHSVLRVLGQTIDVPHVSLRESEAEGPDPIQRPNSPEIPERESDNRYQLQGEIARGGMGAIIKGRDTDLGRDLAIKVLLDSHKDKPEVIQRPQRCRSRPREVYRHLRADLSDDGLRTRRGVIHRDLKPTNIMVGAFGEVQVMDWGLAKVLQVGGVADEKKSKTLPQSIIQTMRSGVGSDSPGTFGSVGSETQMGSVMGTPAYMPPEQALGEIDQMDERADVFGLGAILCEILTGKPPYVADDGTRVFRMASRGKLDDAFSRLDASGADEDLIALTKHCLELEPVDRPRDAGVLALRVTGYLESVEEKLREAEVQRAAEAARADAESAQANAERQRAEAESARANEESKRRRTSLALAASVLLLVGLGSGGWSYLLRQEANRQTAEANAQRQHAAEMQTVAKQRDDQRKAAEQAKNSAKAEQKAAVAARKVAEDAEEDGRKLLYATDMQLAPWIWADDDATIKQLNGRLDAHDPRINVALTGKEDLRGFEWYYHKHLPQSGSEVYSGHGGVVIDAALRSDGQLVTLDRRDKLQLRLWDRETRRVISTKHLAKGLRVQHAALSSDGRLVAFVAGDEVQVLDSDSGEVRHQIHSEEVLKRRVRFSRNGKVLVIVDKDVRWRDASSGDALGVAGPTNEIISHNLSLSRDGLTVAIFKSSNSGCEIFQLDLVTGKVVRRACRLAGGPSTLALSPDGKFFVTGEQWDGDIHVYDTDTLQRENSVKAHASRIRSIAFSSDGASLLTAASDGTTKLWTSPRTPEHVATRKEHQRLGRSGAVTKILFSPDSMQAISCGLETVRVWRFAQSDAAVHPLESDGGSIARTFSADGLLVAGESAAGLTLWDAATGHRLKVLSDQRDGRVRSTAFSPDNQLIALGHDGVDSATVSIWDIDEGRKIATFHNAPHAGLEGRPATEFGAWRAAALVFSPDGKRLVTAFGPVNGPRTVQNALVVWDVASRVEIASPSGHKSMCASIAFSHDGSLMVTGSHDGTARVWNTRNWATVQVFRNPEASMSGGWRGMVEGVAFSPDAATVAMASSNSIGFTNSIYLWDVATGTEVAKLEGHPGSVRSVAFSPDGRTLASSGDDRTVRLWNLATRQQLMRLDTGGVELMKPRSLSFSPDGDQLLVSYPSVVWSTKPSIWEEPDRAAEKLAALLDSDVDFASRIRMFSENLRLHEALQRLQEEKKDSELVQAALAATRANWHASHERWSEAAKEYARLRTLDAAAYRWLRAHGLVRVARALIEQDEPSAAANILAHAAGRMQQDGITATSLIGIVINDFLPITITEITADSPASRAGLLAGDVILTVNDEELTEENFKQFSGMLAGGPGTKIALTVQHPESDQPEQIELTKELVFSDKEVHQCVSTTRALVDQRLADDSSDGLWLEVRAAVFGLKLELEAQITDYTAAIETLSNQSEDEKAEALARIYRRRGDAYVELKQWQAALDDYDRVMTDHQDAAVDPRVLRKRATANEQLGNWNAAEADYSKAITADPSDLEWLGKRARAHEQLEDWEAAAADWSRAAKDDLERAQLVAAFARRVAGSGPSEVADVQLKRAIQLCEQVLGENALSQVIVEELAQLLFELNAPRWTVLEPMEMTSKLGANLELQDHNSILVSGKNGKDDYTIKFNTKATGVIGLRLEALPDPSLPSGGPGRSSSGNFVLSEVELRVAPSSDPEKSEVVALQSAAADYSQPSWAIAGAIDGDDKTGWAVIPEINVPHTAIFQTKQVGHEGGSIFIIKLSHKSVHKNHTLGRFRLSVTDDSAAIGHETARAAAMNISNPWTRLAAAYAWHGRSEEATRRFSNVLRRAVGHEARKAVIEQLARFDEVLAAFAEQNPDDPQLQLALARNLAAQGQEILADKEPASADALDALQKAQQIFDRFVNQDSAWTVLKPIEMKSETGAEFKLQEDGSVFVSGPEGKDTYSLVFETKMRDASGLRLEAMTDPRLPRGGPGRFNPNFVLSDLTLHAAAADSPGKLTPVGLRNAFANFSQQGFEVTAAIDGDVETGWAISPRIGENHTAVFSMAEPLGDGKANRLSIQLTNQFRTGSHLLGRFRLSFTNDATTLEVARYRLQIADDELVDLNIALGKTHALLGQTEEATEAFVRGLKLSAGRQALRQLIAAASPFDAVFTELSELSTDNVPFLVDLVRHYADHGKVQLAATTQAKARTLLEQQLAADPSHTGVARSLADLLVQPLDAKVLVPTSEHEAVLWRYSTSPPADDWMQEEFDDSGWITSPGGFGKESTPGAVVRTAWTSNDIWLRRSFEWKPDPSVKGLLLRLHHDEGFELFINGQQVFTSTSYTTDYGFYALDAKALSLLSPGANTLSVHCHQTKGNQYIDVGIHGMPADPGDLNRHFAAMRMTLDGDPWQKLAAAYHAIGDKESLDKLLERHPTAVTAIGDLSAAIEDWEGAVAGYTKAIALASNDADLFAKRAEAYEKLELWEEAIDDWSKTHESVADKNKKYNRRPALIRRAHIYERLRQFYKALADHNEAIEFSNAGTDPLVWRALHWAQRGRWKEADDDYRQLWEKRDERWYIEWTYSRDRALINLLAGDTDGYRKATDELLTRTDGGLGVDAAGWLLRTFIVAPEMITDKNRDRLLKAAEIFEQAGNKLAPRMRAALHYRLGEIDEAARLFGDNQGPGVELGFLAAMANLKAGNKEQASEFLKKPNQWMQTMRENSPGDALPKEGGWRKWAMLEALKREAEQLIGEPVEKPPAPKPAPKDDDN